MKISKWMLENYGPFRGKHAITLPPDVDVFAVTGRREADEESSNWTGKSYFVKSLALALFDEYPSELADGWITDGEKVGGVGVRLEPESVLVSRIRESGKSTALVIERDGEQASGKHGQAALVDLLGLGAKDFFATSFVRQKQVNRFVTATPGERLAIVAEWLGLDRLRKCRAAAAKQFLAARREVEKQTPEAIGPLLERLDEDVLGEKVEVITEEVLDRVRSEIAGVDSELEVLENKIGEAAKGFADDHERRVELLRLQADARAFDSLAAEGKRLQATLKTLEEIPDEKVEEAHEKLLRANVAAQNSGAEVVRTKKLVQGKFDGHCPVNGRDCPVADEIRADGKKARQLCEKAEATHANFVEAADSAETEYDSLVGAAAGWKSATRSLKEIADRARPLKDARKRAEELEKALGEAPDVKASYEALLEERASLKVWANRAAAWLRSYESYQDRNRGVEEKARAAKAALAVAADQVEVFARAEREIGRATLLEIEEMANRLLARAEVDLSVRMSWGRETGVLEPACHRCGWQYPRGRGTKECADCGAERLPKIEERLDLVASARSDGAAEDLAGLAVNLAAAAWLRAERGVRLGVVVLDEVTASLDRANRKAIGRVLRQMIREAGFEQGFVISHSPDVVEGLPGRIEIVEARDGSRRIEVA